MTTALPMFARVDRDDGRGGDARADAVAPAPASSDEELMLAYAAGNSDGFSLLFRRVAPMLLRIAERQLGRAADAQDVVQQTFLQLHRARCDFVAGMKLRPWIVTITLNLARDLLRRRGRWQTSAIDEHTLVAPDTVSAMRDAAADGVRVRAALASLPADQREVIVLHWFEELPFHEIAQVVAATPGAARVRAHRGYVMLRKLLADDSQLPPCGEDGSS